MSKVIQSIDTSNLDTEDNNEIAIQSEGRQVNSTSCCFCLAGFEGWVSVTVYPAKRRT